MILAIFDSQFTLTKKELPAIQQIGVSTGRSQSSHMFDFNIPATGWRAPVIQLYLIRHLPGKTN
jgi:hypothetical protein